MFVSTFAPLMTLKKPKWRPSGQPQISLRELSVAKYSVELSLFKRVYGQYFMYTPTVMMKWNWIKISKTASTKIVLTPLILNKLRWYAHFQFPDNQITWSRLLIHIQILNDKQCRSRSVSFFRSQLIWIYTVWHVVYSKRRVKQIFIWKLIYPCLIPSPELS